MSTQKEINTRIKLKRDTETNWEAASDKTILNGEVVLVDSTDGRLRAKIGDGSSKYDELEFLECVHVITEENKDEEIPTNAIMIIDTTEDDLTGGGTGSDGYSPTVSVTTITGGHTVTITDIDGVKSFNVMNGTTPVKGTHYWTEADKDEIVAAVLSQIPNGNEVAY